MFGPLPIGPQAVQRPADGFITHTPRGHTLVMAHLCGQGEGPDARGLAIGTRGLMQALLELLTLGSGECRCNALGPRRLFGHAGQAGRIKGMEDIADGLHATAHGLRDRLRRQPAGTRQDNLGTTHAEGIGGPPVRF